MFRTLRVKRRAIFFLVLFVFSAFVHTGSSSLAQESTGSDVDLNKALQDFSKLIQDDTKDILSSPELASSFNPATIFVWIIFGAIGFIAFVYGKKNSQWRPMVIGVVLMVYPYFCSGILLLYCVGIALTAALYFWRE